MKDSVLPSTEHIVYMVRKLHWTRDQIGELTIPQFYEILKELYFQESVDKYWERYNVALILAAISNTIPRKPGAQGKTASDFFPSKEPTRETQKETKTDLESLARAKGIKLPEENE